jgi:hypothetical protein
MLCVSFVKGGLLGKVATTCPLLIVRCVTWKKYAAHTRNSAMNIAASDFPQCHWRARMKPAGPNISMTISAIKKNAGA